ncbi:MAG: DEAD/DEAH box helicase [Phycisphaerae bacterium]|nr:DEAD/DEAH box helicase [Phycisphaerae bacterium]
MAQVTIKRGNQWDAVDVDVDDSVQHIAAELAQIILPGGGEPRQRGFTLSLFNLLRTAREIAVVVKRSGASCRYDDWIRARLGGLADEIASREGAAAAPSITEQELVDFLAEASFTRALKPTQVTNVARLLALRHGANFSVPGAGKTTMLLAVHAALLAQRRVDRLLVVAPKNAMISWEDEIEVCFSRTEPFRVRRLAGGRDGVERALRDDPHIAFITYQLLPNVERLVGEWAFGRAAHVVLDESHRVKGGVDGFTAGAALRLSAAAIRRDVLSGTPLPQSSEDLRPQLEFLWPGQHILPEPRRGLPSPADLADLQGRVRPLYVRTTKSQLGLRQPQLERIPVRLGPVQKELYELLRSEAKRQAAGMSAIDRAFLRRLGRHVIRLIEAATNPALLTKGLLIDEDEVVDEQSQQSSLRAFDLIREFARREKSAKLTAARALVDQSLRSDASAKVVLWTTFIENIRTLENMLAAYKPVLLYGAVGTGDEDDPETREGRIRQFHRDAACRVMVANPAACGEGISLHRVCHHAIYVDRTFNAAHFLQSVDRIHRLGLAPDQLTRVSVLEAEGTIDANIARRLKEKIDVMATILDDPGLQALAYDPDDIIEEFPAGLELADVEGVIDHLTGDASQTE